MAGDFRLNLSLFGDTQLLGDLLKVVDALQDASPWFDMMHGWFEQEIEQQFESEGAHFGTPWKALSPAYAAAKLAEWGPKQILQARGDLRQALTSKSGGAVRYTSRHMMVFGGDVRSDDGVDIGAVHQRGTKDGRIPARQMLNLGEARNRQVTRSAGLYFRTGEIRRPGDLFGG